MKGFLFHIFSVLLHFEEKVVHTLGSNDSYTI